MRGLLGTEFDDPKTQGLLSLGLALLNGRGNLGQALSDAGSHGMAAYNAARDAKDSRETRALQRKQLEGQLAMQQAQAAEAERMRAFEAARMQALRDSVTPGQTMPMPATMDARDIGTPGAPALQTPGGLDLQGYAMRLAQAGDPSAVQVFQALQKAKPAPITAKPGDIILQPQEDGTMRQLFAAPAEKKDDATNDMREYRFAVSQGYQGTFEQYQRQMKAAGATRVQTTVNSGPKAFWSDFGKQSSEQFAASRAAAQAAADTIRSVQQIQQAVAGGAFQGKGAELKLEVSKAMGAIGMPYDAKTVANTEAFNAAAKAFVLDRVKSLGANPSNADREFIEATVPRLQTDPAALPKLLNYLEGQSRRQIDTYNQMAAQVQAAPEAQFLPFGLTVNAPPPLAPARPAQGRQAAPPPTSNVDALLRKYGGQ